MKPKHLFLIIAAAAICLAAAVSLLKPTAPPCGDIFRDTFEWTMTCDSEK